MAPFIRILLRYLSGPLVLLGWILPDEQADIIADPDLVFWITQVLGWGVPMIVEGWYGLARRRGWKK